ncbi:MAG: methionine--tRNA ligase [bacterium]|nr:methionine--tRNA ligase [bacterium]
MANKFYITTPIYYVNDKPHLGHAYTTIAADVLARFHRMKGDDTFFLTGTDEHGAKIQEIAEKQGKAPKEFVDEIAASFAMAWDTLNISNDFFLRTTNPEHEKVVAYVLQKLYDEKYIYKGEYKALYCVGCEQYKTQADLVDGLCPDHKRAPEVHSEEAYMFALSKLEKKLLKAIKSDELEIKPVERKNEVLSFIENEGLRDVAISRRKEKVSWGIELPFDKNHTCYVWVDAFLNYLTGLGWSPYAETSEDKPKNKDYQKFWPADVQLMSKDILRVHATIWPGLLLALGEDLQKTMFIHGYFTIDGQKMSKSLGNVIDPVKLAQEYGVDVVRFYLLKEIPFGNDGDVSIEKLKKCYDSQLANGLGNLVARVLGMSERYFDGVVPPITSSRLTNVWNAYEDYMARFQLDQALETVLLFMRELDRFIDQQQPWTLAKIDKEKLAEVMYILLESLRHIARMLWPFMPSTSEKIFEKLSIVEQERAIKYSEAKTWGELTPGTKVAKGESLFSRLQT